MVHAEPLPRSAGPARPVPVTGAGAGALALAAGLAIVTGIALGIAATIATIRSDAIGTVRIGPWRLEVDAGAPSPNPYQRARMARAGEIPLTAAEGLTAVAREDSGGAALDGRCSYRVAGPIPPVRFWTLEAATTSGSPVMPQAASEVVTSTDVLRDGAGRASITLSPTVQPGNWLPLPGAGRFALVLRLYDAGMTGLPTRTGVELDLPSITRLGCAA